MFRLRRPAAPSRRVRRARQYPSRQLPAPRLLPSRRPRPLRSRSNTNQVSHRAANLGGLLLCSAASPMWKGAASAALQPRAQLLGRPDTGGVPPRNVELTPSPVAGGTKLLQPTVEALVTGHEMNASSFRGGTRALEGESHAVGLIRCGTKLGKTPEQNNLAPGTKGNPQLCGKLCGRLVCHIHRASFFS